MLVENVGISRERTTPRVMRHANKISRQQTGAGNEKNSFGGSFTRGKRYGHGHCRRPAHQSRTANHDAFLQWTGFYAGINGGGGWARVSWVDNGIGAVTHRSDGGMVGGQLGYRWQMNQLVVGIEGTEDWTRLKDSVTVLGLTENFKVNTLYTVTGQFGWAIDRVLLFVKGGWARATTEITLGGISGSRSRTVNGWTIGGGLDYALWQNWSIGVEYDHASLNYGNRRRTFNDDQ
jgi:outer membrane immunogenic protein